MEKSDSKVGKLFPVFAIICVIALPFVIRAALSYEPEITDAMVNQPDYSEFDNNVDSMFENYKEVSENYIQGQSSDRSLGEYYSRRQYAGSPPFIPHKIEDDRVVLGTCLNCHAKGGWTEELKRNTPVTPHPENEYCRQCHVKKRTEDLFVGSTGVSGTNWESVPPPKLGRSHLPGSPPPIPHQLQLRGNCPACHVGPGAVTPIRVEHPMRGYCRQCHVPDSTPGIFVRKSS